MSNIKNSKSLYIPVKSRDGITHQLHIKRLWNDRDNEAHAPLVVMFHGIIENGRIFYKGREKGLANFLARQGYNVHVVDFRGRGLSTPRIKEHNDFGQYETIMEDIPAVVNYLSETYQKPFHVICHSYGGVLFSSALVRHCGFNGMNGFDDSVLSLTCFGTKRQVNAPTFDRYFKVSLVWNRLVPWLAKRKGYFDAKKWRFGDDSESLGFIEQSVNWIRSDDWIDPVDGFNYEAKAKGFNWPPVWHFSAQRDYSLGHALDVQRFFHECHIDDGELDDSKIEKGHKKLIYTHLSKRNGNLEDYDHINMLTHSSAEQDHFPQIAERLQSIDKSL